jgi:hypothetical protein
MKKFSIKVDLLGVARRATSPLKEALESMEPAPPKADRKKSPHQWEREILRNEYFNRCSWQMKGILVLLGRDVTQRKSGSKDEKTETPGRSFKKTAVALASVPAVVAAGVGTYNRLVPRSESTHSAGARSSTPPKSREGAPGIETGTNNLTTPDPEVQSGSSSVKNLDSLEAAVVPVLEGVTLNQARVLVNGEVVSNDMLRLEGNLLSILPEYGYWIPGILEIDVNFSGGYKKHHEFRVSVNSEFYSGTVDEHDLQLFADAPPADTVNSQQGVRLLSLSNSSPNSLTSETLVNLCADICVELEWQQNSSHSGPVISLPGGLVLAIGDGDNRSIALATNQSLITHPTLIEPKQRLKSFGALALLESQEYRARIRVQNRRVSVVIVGSNGIQTQLTAFLTKKPETFNSRQIQITSYKSDFTVKNLTVSSWIRHKELKKRQATMR